MAHDHSTTTCPDAERIADFAEQRLDAALHETVDAHLAACDGCFDQVVHVRWAIEQERALVGAPFPVTPAERSARERARALFSEPLGRAVFRLLKGALELVSTTGASWEPVAVPAVRGAGDADARDLWEAAFPAGELSLRIEVERTGAGCVVAAGIAAPGGAEAPAGTSVALLRDGTVVALQPATAEPADLAEVGPGAFAVEVRRDGGTLGRAELHLQAA